MTGARTPAPLAQAFPAVRSWLEHGPASEDAPPRTAACEVAERFGLDPFGRNVLLFCAYCALEPEAQEAVGRLMGDPLATAPTVGLVLSRLPGAHWRALAADAPLRRAGLVRLDGGTLSAARIRLADTVLFRLLGAPALDETVAGALAPVRPARALAANRARLASDIGLRLRVPGDVVLHLLGGDAEGKLLAYAAAAEELGETVHALNAQIIPPVPGDLLAFARIVARDMALCGARLAIVHDDLADSRLTQLFAEAYAGPLAIVSADAIRVGGRTALRLEMPVPTAAEQVSMWRHALGGLAGELEPVLPRLAAAFRVAPETARGIAAELSAVASAGGGDLGALAWDACRRAARPRMDDLARRADSPAGWDDLILPRRQKEVLDSIVAQVRNRARVHEDWGFGPRLQNKGLGVSALFSGPSGAGKSMAGELIGNALSLDVYRVDLSALVSKWVGETEKNLRRVFDAAEDGGVVLQFDEADALFGRRSEVKDSHDRHANIEVSYLLQRLEAYRGLCILTTNMKDNIDEAFLRRLSFMVDFRFPGRAERRAIWGRIFPADLPLGTLDYDLLAQLNVSGGSIRNIALGASFLAADRDGEVTMAEIFQAAQLEYDKVGRTMTDAERAGWLQ